MQLRENKRKSIGMLFFKRFNFLRFKYYDRKLHNITLRLRHWGKT